MTVQEYRVPGGADIPELGANQELVPLDQVIQDMGGTTGSLESQGSLHLLPSTSLHIDAPAALPQQQPVCSPRQGRPPRKQAQHSRRSSLVFYFLLLIAASGPAIVLMNALLKTGPLGGGDSRVKIALPPGSPAAPTERLSWAQVAEAKRQAIRARSLSGMPQRLIDGSSDVHAASGATQELATTSGRSNQEASTATNAQHGSHHFGGHERHRSRDRKGIDYMAKAQKGPHPMRLKYPVLWGGAFFSRSGYGTEAVSYIAGLLQSQLVDPRDVWIAQAGDYVHDVVVNSMEPGLRELLLAQEFRNLTQVLDPLESTRPLISICHSFPDCWRTPEDDDPRLTVRRALKSVGDFFKYKVFRKPRRDNGCPCPHHTIKEQVVYHVGRTMFETERLPAPLAAYSEYVDEVWVPSEFNRQSFAASGVKFRKLHTLAQGINTTLFDPAKHRPMDLIALGGQLVMGREPPQSSSSHHSSRGGSSHLHREEDIHRLWQQDRVVKAAAAAAAAAALSKESGLGSEHSSSDSAEGLGDGSEWDEAGESGSGSNWLEAALESGAELLGAGRRQPFRFLSVFKWEARKGWDILLETYAKEFRGDEDVELHIITKEAFEKVDDFKSYVRKAVAPHLGITHESQWEELPRVYLHTRHVPEPVYPRVYRSVDALVIPTHGEGWGRPQIEAMAMGLPVISTNWSGLTAFISDAVAYPIRVEGVVDVDDTGPNSFEWFQGQRWASPSPDHLRELMRYVVTHRGAAAAKGAAARALVTREFSLHAVALKVLAELLRLQDEVDDLMSVQLPEGSIAAAAAGGSLADAGAAAGAGAGGGLPYGTAITVPGDQAQQQQQQQQQAESSQQLQQGQDYYRQGALSEQYQGTSQGGASGGSQGGAGEAYGGSTLRGDPSAAGAAGSSRTTGNQQQQQQQQDAAGHGQHSKSTTTIPERSWDLGVTKVVLSLAGDGQAFSLTEAGGGAHKGAGSGTAAARWSGVTGLLSRHRRHALTRKRDKK